MHELRRPGLNFSAPAPDFTPRCRLIETFTFLDRNTTRQVALTWKESLSTAGKLRILPSTRRDLERAWKYFDRPDLHKLSAVDAVSFVMMTDRRIRMAFAFDGHFAEAGFQ